MMDLLLKEGLVQSTTGPVHGGNYRGKLQDLRWLRTVGGATALAFAIVLGFTAVTGRFAASFALAIVLAFAGVLVCVLV